MSSNHLFWDSCIFIRYLIGDQSAEHFEDISRYVEEAKNGKWNIYFSTITFAEIRQEFFKSDPFGSIKEFFSDLGANFIPIEPNPNILIQTGELRSARSTNPGDPNPPAQRSIATPDAIIMVSCLYARDALGIQDIVLHSTDEGKGKSWAGRAVPVLGFERWFPESTRTPMVSQVCSLPRKPPAHPEPMLKGIIISGRFPKPQQGAQGGTIE